MPHPKCLTRWYTLADHGLTNVISVVINNNGNWNTYYVRNIDGNNVKFSTNQTGTAGFLNNTNNAQVFVYLPNNKIKATRSTETYYYPNTGLTQ